MRIQPVAGQDESRGLQIMQDHLVNDSTRSLTDMVQNQAGAYTPAWNLSDELPAESIPGQGLPGPRILQVG